MKCVVVLAVISAPLVFASGKQTPLPANTAEVAVSSETAPPGGTVQLKFSLTEPRPISSTGTLIDASAFSVDGVALSSSAPTSAGIGVLQNGKLRLTAISPAGDLGMNTDYPFLTVTMDVPTTAQPGVISVSPSSVDLSTSSGALTTIVKPGQITIGGRSSIRNVVPGGGMWPAGTVVRVLGTGFSSGSQLRTKLKGTAQYVGPGEIDFTLKSASSMDGQMFQVLNPDGSQCLYYSYLRGTYVQQPAHALLRQAEPAFALQTWSTADLGPVPVLGATEFLGVALQNPSLGPVSVMLELKSGSGSPVQATFVLPSGSRLMDGIAELLNGAVPQPGDVLRITSTSPVQVLGIRGDDVAGTASPFLPN